MQRLAMVLIAPYKALECGGVVRTETSRVQNLHEIREKTKLNKRNLEEQKIEF